MGVYVHKDILRADITVSLTRPSRPALATAWRSTTLWHGLFPYATFAFDDLDLRVLTFAPVPEGYSSSPPAVLVCLELTNRGDEAHEVELRVEHGRWALDGAEELAHGQDARAGLVSVSTLTEGLELVHGSEGSVVRGKVPAGTTSPWALAVCMGETLGSLASPVAKLSALGAQGWLEATERRLTGHVGGLGTARKATTAPCLCARWSSAARLWPTGATAPWPAAPSGVRSITVLKCGCVTVSTRRCPWRGLLPRSVPMRRVSSPPTAGRERLGDGAWGVLSLAQGPLIPSVTRWPPSCWRGRTSGQRATSNG